MSDWCILRTSGGRTLRLATSLRAAGIDAWTPSLTRKWRRPRSKVEIDREVAIVPSFVFAAEERLADLLAISINPLSPHPQFALFRYGGRIPVVADREIEGLRESERREKLRVFKPSNRRKLQQGELVRPSHGPWTGLEGVVEDVAGNFAIVCFNGLRVKIASWRIEEDELQAA